MDIKLQKMAQGISNRQYNIGLKMAQEGDLSGAIQTLLSSLQTNKKNTYARNLLGLCHYARGGVGEALREWTLSCHYQSEGNLAKSYLEDMGSDLPALEQCNEALKGYNEALAFFRDGNEDLAVIRLKRAVEILPRFVDAMNLLALHHLKTDDKTKAAAMAERVLAIDKGNETAKQYYFAIFQKHYGEKSARPIKTSRTEIKPQEKQEKPAGKTNPLGVRTQRAFTKASPVSGIVSAILGMGAMFLFMQLLVFPGMLSERDEEFRTLQTQAINQQQDYQYLVNELNNDIQDLQTQIAQLDNQNTERLTQLADMENEMLVRDAQQLLNDNLPSEALTMLDMVDLSSLRDETLSTYENIRLTAAPLAEVAYHTQAVAFFNAGNHANARIAWENAAQHSLEGSSHGGDILYWLGRIAEIDGDPARALLYYETALDNWPTFSRRWQAQSRRNALG
ncbi:MAG: tetratricopeptide repeat protein [Defluviitaleaceae bacterium]|nr:tetratricopeptide repeat protein [Defluviitaleaceae bacterium]